MIPPHLLVLQLSETGPLGHLERWLREAGAELTVLRTAEQQTPSTLAGYDAVICLGGESGAYDDAVHPWLGQVRLLLSHAVSKRVPVLAVCLGAQLLAVATGGQVRVGSNGPEVGPMLVAKRDLAGQDPLFAELPWTPEVLQFHNDEVHVLPPSAELLASSPQYPNQAFRVGESAYGIQFHIETTPEMVQEWAALDPESAATARPGHLELEHLAAVHDDLAETWRPFANRFVQLASGQLAPAVGRTRNLPLI